MKKRNEIDIFISKESNLRNLDELSGQVEARAYVKITNAFNAAVKASGCSIERLKLDQTLETKTYRQIFFYYCLENKLCSPAIAASFFDRDRVTCYNGWQLIERMLETKDNYYLLAFRKFEHHLSMIENNYEFLINSIKFDALSMSDRAFTDKYSILLF